ncbi:MAG: peptidoglycan-associated lipoprotein Pal [Pseudomonadota bacterium]
MKMTTKLRFLSLLIVLISVGALFGCAGYEVNTMRSKVPGIYIRSEMQEADRAIEAARQAGKDKACPDEFKAAEDARSKAYDVFRSCRTEEGVALAKKATEQANALCPKKEPAKVVPAPAPVVQKAPEPVKPPVQEVKTDARAAALQALMGEDVYFYYDSAALTPAAQELLKKDAAILEKYSDVSITLEGNCDERGTNEYNLALGERRAESAKKFLIDLGIAASRLKTVSYGEEKPVDTGHNEDAWSKNRRTHFVVD